MSSLKRRAKAAGASAEEIEDADDADEPKAAMISLILAREGEKMPELAQLKPSALKKRARVAGASVELRAPPLAPG